MEFNNIDFLQESKIASINNWDKKLAPVTYSMFKKTNSPEPDWWVGSAKLVKSPIGIFYSDNISASAGTSIFPKEALLRTVGETLERYSSTNSHLTDQVYPMFVNEQLGFVRCADFEKTAKSYKRDGLTEEIEHSKVVRLIDGGEEYLPFEYLHLGFIRFDKRFMHTPPISTGCAFYYDTNTAIWKGICEVVERDAMMRLWYTKGKAVKINTNHIKDYALYTRIKKIRDAGLKLHLFEISSTINLPVVFAILEGSVFPYNCVGASCSSDIVSAISKAIDESVSIRIMANWNRYESKENYDYEDFSWVNRLEKHMELYANWKDTPAFDFLTKDSGVEIIDLEDLIKQNRYLKAPENHDELIEMAKLFKNKGFDIYWKDITIDEVKRFGHVIKVVIPQMIPLSQAYECRWLGAFTERQLNDVLNPYPHPFA